MVTRRQFLKATAGLGGGLAVPGVASACRDRGQPAPPGLRAGRRRRAASYTGLARPVSMS
jgi:hypothetical protein